VTGEEAEETREEGERWRGGSWKEGEGEVVGEDEPSGERKKKEGEGREEERGCDEASAPRGESLRGEESARGEELFRGEVDVDRGEREAERALDKISEGVPVSIASSTSFGLFRSRVCTWRG
jgi:hypothetical protein